MFLPSEQLAERILLCQQRQPAEPLSVRALRDVFRYEGFSEDEIAQETSAPAVRRLDANSRHEPVLGSPVDLDEVRHTIGEELERLLGTLARWCGFGKDREEVPVVSAARHFEPLITEELAGRLGLPEQDEGCRQALQGLAEEFYRWAQGGGKLETRGRLEFTPDRRLILVCVGVGPSLDPLPPLR